MLFKKETIYSFRNIARQNGAHDKRVEAYKVNTIGWGLTYNILQKVFTPVSSKNKENKLLLALISDFKGTTNSLRQSEKAFNNL